MKHSYLANNIKALRKYHDESQDDLARVLHLESKSSISEYEHGKTKIDDDTIQRIADYYAVTVEDLVNSDLSYLAEHRVKLSLGFEMIDVMFPMLNSETAQHNSEFREAYSCHCKYRERIRNNDNTDNDDFDQLFKCFDLYEYATEDENARFEASVNFVSLCLLCSLLLESIGIIKNKPAVITRLLEEHPDLKRSIVNDEIESIESEELNNIKKELYTDTSDTTYKLLKSVCNNEQYSEIGYYYLAMCYWVNYTDNSNGLLRNRAIGFEMLNSLSRIENKYARDLLETIITTS